ncbi:hypothetical protein ABSA28_00691 [Candidatus Hepatincolaceae symbiont of Richtersius coronifer]
MFKISVKHLPFCFSLLFIYSLFLSPLATAKVSAAINPPVPSSGTLSTTVTNNSSRVSIRISDELKEAADKEIAEVLNNNPKNSLNLKNPVFIISEGVETSNYINSTELCNSVNTQGANITCLVYPVENAKSDIPSFIRNGVKSKQYDATGVNGDFVIVRKDIVKLYKENKGPLKGAPILDLVMYLNGDYFFMFSPKDRGAFSLEQLFSDKIKDFIRIGFITPQSRAVFEGIVRPLFPRNKFIFKQVSDVKGSLCSSDDVDIFMYLGIDYTSEIKEAFTNCSNKLTPITLLDSTLSSILAGNDIFSVSNVVSYYDSNSILNFQEIYTRFESEYKQKIMRKEREDQEKKDEKVEEKANYISDANFSNSGQLLIKEADIRRLPGSKAVIDQKFRGALPGIQKSLAVDTPKIYITGNTVVKTFGIRYALLASRYAKRDDVINLFDALVRNYFTLRENFLTPDMSKFGVADIILGTSPQHILDYHVGMYKYSRVLLESKLPRTAEQNLAIRLLTTNLPQQEAPYFYGPLYPDQAQLNVISNKLVDLNQKKKEFNAVKIFQKDIKEIESALEAMRKGNPVINGVLKAADIADMNNRNTGVGPQGEVLAKDADSRAAIEPIFSLLSTSNNISETDATPPSSTNALSLDASSTAGAPKTPAGISTGDIVASNNISTGSAPGVTADIVRSRLGSSANDVNSGNKGGEARTTTLGASTPTGLSSTTSPSSNLGPVNNSAANALSTTGSMAEPVGATGRGLLNSNPSAVTSSPLGSPTPPSPSQVLNASVSNSGVTSSALPSSSVPSFTALPNSVPTGSNPPPSNLSANNTIANTNNIVGGNAVPSNTVMGSNTVGTNNYGRP